MAVVQYVTNALFSSPLPISWSITVAAILLFLCPLMVLKLWWRRVNRFGFTIAGAWCGAIALHFSVWLYIQYFFGPLRGLLFGLPGVLLLGLHFSPFGGPSQPSHMIVASGDIQTVLESITFRRILFWIVIYSLLGLIIDQVRYARAARVGRRLSE